jgi:hypothetical protein
MIGADLLQRLGEPRQFMLVLVLDPQLEGSDLSALERRLEAVGKDSADVLRADQIELARLRPYRRRKDGQIDLVYVHGRCISESGSLVQ